MRVSIVQDSAGYLYAELRRPLAFLKSTDAIAAAWRQLQTVEATLDRQCICSVTIEWESARLALLWPGTLQLLSVILRSDKPVHAKRSKPGAGGPRKRRPTDGAAAAGADAGAAAGPGGAAAAAAGPDGAAAAADGEGEEPGAAEDGGRDDGPESRDAADLMDDHHDVFDLDCEEAQDRDNIMITNDKHPPVENPCNTCK